MSIRTISITPAIIDTLYNEALTLAEETRATFECAGLKVRAGSNEAQIGLSCEALRTTTRMMHALAWLLNHRAFFAGELSEFQLRRHGRLPQAQPESDLTQLDLLDPAIIRVVEQSIALFARIERLDQSWRLQGLEVERPVLDLRRRIGQSFAVSSS